jgi:predicted GNAT family acetyltransferase
MDVPGHIEAMIFDDTGRQRFEQEEDGRQVFASYRLQGGAYALVHVEADPALRGTGAAGRFMTALVQHARMHGLKLQPFCSYARAWFQRHPEARDILP